MHGSDTRETWPFECLRCQHIWAEEYVLRQLTDKRGNITEVWLSDGLPVQPPLGGTRCPVCQATSVTAFPKGYLDRHPDLTYRESLDLGVMHPEAGRTGSASPAESLRVPLPRATRPTPRRLVLSRAVYVTAIALAAFLIAAYEVYEVLLTKARPH